MSSRDSRGQGFGFIDAGNPYRLTRMEFFEDFLGEAWSKGDSPLCLSVLNGDCILHAGMPSTFWRRKCVFTDGCWRQATNSFWARIVEMRCNKI